MKNYFDIMSLDIIKKYKISAKKWFWQNFLVNNDIIKQISNIIEIKSKNIVEIWPWYWALTEKLLMSKPSKLDLVELDNDMVSILEDRLRKNELCVWETIFTINKQDVLKYEPQFVSYSVIANIPYYITSPILRHFLYDLKNKPIYMIILMQKEVWDKILNTPISSFWTNKKYKSSVLGLFIAKKSYVHEKIIVDSQNFFPSPKVKSSVLLFETHDLYQDIDDEKFFKIIKIWFSNVRKKLITNFEKAWYDKDIIIGILKNIWFSTDVRSENLWIKQWCEFVRQIW